MKLKFISELCSHKIRALKTLVTFLGYVCIGLQGSVLGVALLDLQILAGCGFNQISLTVTGRSVGYAFGSLISGLIDKKFNAQLTLSMLLFVTAITQFFIPIPSTLTIMTTIYTINGLAGGIADCVSNVFILKLWAKECLPFLQGLQFCYGVGGLAASIITGPYVKDHKTLNEHEFEQSNNSSTVPFEVNSTDEKSVLTYDDIELMAPYSMIGTFTLFVSALFLLLFIKYRVTSDHPSRINSNETKVEQSMKVINPKVRVLVISISSLFMLFQIGLEKTIGAFIIAFVHEGPLQLSKQTGANISAAFWITFSCFKLVAILVADFIGSLGLLAVNLINTTIACGILVLLPSSESMLWFSFCFLGIGLSSTWASMFGFLESKFPLNGTIVAYFTVGGCIGASIFPPFIGYLMATNYFIFAWYSFASCLLLSLLLLIIFTICKSFLFQSFPDPVFRAEKGVNNNLQLN